MELHDTEPEGGREAREGFDAMTWMQQVTYTATRPLDTPMMRHIARRGDPAARMALALRDDLPDTIRRILARDDNPQVRFNLANGFDDGDA